MTDDTPISLVFGWVELRPYKCIPMFRDDKSGWGTSYQKITYDREGNITKVEYCEPLCFIYHD